MRTSQLDSVIAGQIDVAPGGAGLDLHGGFPDRFEPKVIINRRMLLPIRGPRARSIR